MTVATIAFDGDDTLWHNENHYARTEERFQEILSAFAEPEALRSALYATEMRNLPLYGYGTKGFTLSMIETALHVSDHNITNAQIAQILEAGRALLESPVEPLDGVREALAQAQTRARLLLVTKGDLFDQEQKLAKSELEEFFDAVEIVSAKDPATYSRILQKHAVSPEEFVMVGNSVKSDIEPVLAIGASAVHVPYHLTWAHETGVLDEPNSERARTIAGLSELAGALDSLSEPV